MIPIAASVLKAARAKFCDSILRHCGMVTSICEDAARVAPMLNEFKPDLVLLDMYLPSSNGIEIAQHIRNQPRHAFLPIVFLTGENNPDARSKLCIVLTIRCCLVALSSSSEK